MVSLRYHISTIIAVFVALGLGLVIGGTMGQSLFHDAQGQMLQSLHNRYKDLTVQHELVQGELRSYHELTRQLAPEMNGMHIVWQGRHDQQAEQLIQRLRQLGAVVTVEEEPARSDTKWEVEPDLLLVAGSAHSEPLAVAMSENTGEAGAEPSYESHDIPVLDMRKHRFDGSIHENTARLIKLVQETILERESPHAASVSHYSGME
ncbi:hypothetical protein DUZ99_16840 [Xylanibacillus composti]|uniref:Copper transporter n=1 Tax=Xylanibacillus composti TaxID=1572762 RepID=A0A8J4M283_9BACL|nr:copper transporter [Xylanibacillus composti]MDT9726645.1 hypothetical protein [Xylanibacillus composti]GIQ69424.1 hypothetical protein XYCOK13_22480 [Xylanibacillus composti]